MLLLEQGFAVTAGSASATAEALCWCWHLWLAAYMFYWAFFTKHVLFFEESCSPVTAGSASAQAEALCWCWHLWLAGSLDDA